jgi:N-acetylated-alpha-linked acidic dipeptidase
MEKFGDHDWSYHIACTKLWALAVARLVESPLIAFSATDYAKGLESYLHQIEPAADNLPEGSHFDWADLKLAILDFHEYARQFDEYTAGLVERLGEHVPWYRWWKKVHLLFQIRVANDKYKGLEREFLYQPGLDGRNWFKHVVFAPGIWTGYSGTTYPGLVESLEAGDLENAKVCFSREILVLESIVLTYWLVSEMEQDYPGKDEGGYGAAGISSLIPT